MAGLSNLDIWKTIKKSKQFSAHIKNFQAAYLCFFFYLPGQFSPQSDFDKLEK